MDPLTLSLQKTRFQFIRASVFLFLQATLIAGTPYVLMSFFDHVARANPSLVPTPLLDTLTRWGLDPFQSEILVYAAVLIGLGALLAIFARLEETEPLSAALSAMSSWRNELLGQLLRGRLSYFETHSAHDLAARLSDDGVIVETLLVSSLKAFSKSLPTLLLMLAALAFHAPLLAFAFAACVAPFYVFASKSVRADFVRSKRAEHESAHFRHEIEKSLTMLPSLKSLSAEGEALTALSLRSERADEQTLLARRARGALATSIQAAKHVLRAALLVFGAVLFVRGEFHLGPFLLFALYSELMPSAVIELARSVALARSSAPALERLRGLAASLENEEEVEGGRKTAAVPLPDSDALSFNDLIIAKGMTPFSATFETGELIGVVGTPSSGRSTLGRLLNRLRDPLSGTISIGNTQLSNYGLELLRQLVTYVERTPYFMSMSVRDNLALAIQRDSDLDERRVNEAFRAAGVDFINDLPERLETIIGETAYRLTPSEAQRLGVARALLRTDSRIFFFDEVTAGLEASEARAVFEAAQTLAEDGALVFWVTRRADEAAECDRILYLDQTAQSVTALLETPETLLNASGAASERYRKVLGLRGPKAPQAAIATPKPSSRTRGTAAEPIH